MVGNDVVDLRDRSVAAGPRHPRFDARVFAPAEHRALRECAQPNPLRWAFWAAKEAAYKVAKKLDDATIWSPLRFVVSFERPSPASLASGSLRGPTPCGDSGFAPLAFEGAVEHAGRTIPVRVEADAERVHAIAADAREAFARIRARVAELPGRDADPSAAVRALARADLAPLLGAAPEALEIARRGRIPVLRVAGGEAALDLSLSHHGRFVAWACEPLACGRPA